MKKSFWMVLMVLVAMVISACGGEGPTTNPAPETDETSLTQVFDPCTPGEQNQCWCLDGTTSYQECSSDGTYFDTCHCGTCIPGKSYRCTGPGGVQGFQYCGEDGKHFETCVTD